MSSTDASGLFDVLEMQWDTNSAGPISEQKSVGDAQAAGMDLLLEFASTSLAIATVALALFLLQRSNGIPLLEVIPLATGAAILLLSSMRHQSASTVNASTLLIPIGGCAVFAFVLQPMYARWRLRIAGESTTLLLSFASMNFWLLLLSIATSARPAAIGLADSKFVGTKEHLELVVILIAVASLTAIMFYVKRRRLSAALQLAKDDYRLLESFGERAGQVRRHVLVVAAVVCTLGAVLFISLQEHFAVLNSYSILVPAFAISISQSRIRLMRLVAATFVLAACVQLLTQRTSELLRDFHQALLFAMFVMAGITARWATNTGTADRLHRRVIGQTRKTSC